MAKSLPKDIAAIVDSFKLLVDEVDPNINVSGKFDGKFLMMEATLPAKHQAAANDTLKQLHIMLRSAQIDGMDPASVMFENPRSAVKKKIVYSLDASDPAKAHKHVMEDREIVLNTLLTERLLSQAKQAIKEGEQPEAVKAVLEYAQAKVSGEIAEVATWTPRLLELEKSFAATTMHFIARGIDVAYIPDAFDAPIQYINQNSIGGVWGGSDDKGHGRLH